MKIRRLLFILMFCIIKLYTQPGWLIQNSGTTQIINNIYFLNYNLGFAACNGGLLLKTVNGGNSWSILSTFNSDLKRVRFQDHLTGFVFSNDGIFKTTNGGINWIQLNSKNGFIDYSYSNEYNMMASYTDESILRSSNGGTNWGIIYPLGSISNSVFCIDYYTGLAAISGITGGNSNHSIYKTTNSGSQWNLFYQVYTPVGSGKTGDLFFVNQDTGYYSVKINNNNFICRYNGVYWNQFAVIKFPNCLFFINGKIGWSAGENGSIYKTENAGIYWFTHITNVNYNLTSIYFINEYTGWASGDNGTILKTTSGGNPVGINQISSEVPNSYSLSQNYPNPFNPSTKIKFDISGTSVAQTFGTTGFSVLSVYDILGREVATLVNEKLKPGTYEVDWDGTNYTSGVYFYKLISADYAETKRMILIK